MAATSAPSLVERVIQASEQLGVPEDIEQIVGLAHAFVITTTAPPEVDADELEAALETIVCRRQKDELRTQSCHVELLERLSSMQGRKLDRKKKKKDEETPHTSQFEATAPLSRDDPSCAAPRITAEEMYPLLDVPAEELTASTELVSVSITLETIHYDEPAGSNLDAAAARSEDIACVVATLLDVPCENVILRSHTANAPPRPPPSPPAPVLPPTPVVPVPIDDWTLWIIVGASVGGGLALVFVLILLHQCWRRRAAEKARARQMARRRMARQHTAPRPVVYAQRVDPFPTPPSDSYGNPWPGQARTATVAQGVAVAQGVTVVAQPVSGNPWVEPAGAAGSRMQDEERLERALAISRVEGQAGGAARVGRSAGHSVGDDDAIEKALALSRQEADAVAREAEAMDRALALSRQEAEAMDSLRKARGQPPPPPPPPPLPPPPRENDLVDVEVQLVDLGPSATANMRV